MTSKNRQGESAITYTYNIASRLAGVNDGGDVTEYKYDRVGRVRQVISPQSQAVSYEYDKRGLRTKLTYPDDSYPNNSYVNYEYDPMGRLKRIKDSSGNPLAEYTYDELSRRKSVTLNNSNDVNAVYNYDLADRLTKLDNKSGSTHIVFDYTYDKAGNRKTMKVDNNSNNTHSYTYDKIYRLTVADYPGSAVTDYYYNPVGSRRRVVANSVTTDYTSNNLNEYAAVGGVNYSYDDNGNLTYDGTYTYVYDCENRLTEVKQGQTTVATYGYDYLGRRTEKTVYGSPNVVTKYCYDGDNLIGEYDNSGNLLRKYIYGDTIDEPICMITSQGTFYYHSDGLGSVVALSNTTGNIVERYSYDVFGTPMIRDGQGNIISTSAYNNSYMFTGRDYDTETGLYYYRARYYNPTIGRFLQPDPIGYAAGLNLYTYCGNNPVNWIDPYGLKVNWREVARGTGTMVIGGVQIAGGIIFAETGVAPVILLPTGSYVFGYGLAQTAAGFAGGDLKRAPGTISGVATLPFGQRASMAADIAENVATGALNPLVPIKSPLGATEAAVQVLNTIDPFGNEKGSKKGSGGADLNNIDPQYLVAG